MLITLINVLGFAIGIMQKGMTVTESLQRFTLLSIGDGLVSQIPALIVSMAAGMLVTRAASKNSLGQELGKQLLFYPRAMVILTVMLSIFALVPGLPTMPFLVLAIITGWTARELNKRSGLLKASTAAATATKDGKPPAPLRPAARAKSWSLFCSPWTRSKSNSAMAWCILPMPANMAISSNA